MRPPSAHTQRPLYCFGWAAWCLLFAARAAWALSAQEAAQRLDALWAHPKLRGSRVGVLVADCQSGEILYQRLAGASFLPASNAKLPLTACALLLLGPEFRFRTAVLAGGPLDSRGLIQGPLIVTGTADPTAGLDLFTSLSQALRERGVRGAKGLWVEGCLTAAPSDSPQASLVYLAQALTQASFSVNPAGPALLPDGPATPLLEHLSPPLGEIILTINKRSLNAWADNLWRSLAWLAAGRPEAMPAFLTNFWARRGLELQGVYFADGSGLSRRNRATPRFYVGLLRYMYFCTLEWPAFSGSLPVAGRDGTLANRMRTSPAEGRVWGKTGSMHDLSALSGYVHTFTDRILAFSILMNDLTCPAASARYLQDQACALLVQIE
jgi:D-alanyl-D-alanine carboxypeptidase